jgi:hypothetical protein
MAEVNLEGLQAVTLRVLEEQRIIRREMSDVRTLVLGLVDQGLRFERRLGELKIELHETKDDTELMLKAEIMGRVGNVETRIDIICDRVSAIETGPPPG